MPEYPPRIKRLIRQYGDQAYEAELNQALNDLDQHFATWRTGELNAFELSQHIHEFYRGPSRELWNRYNSTLPDSQVPFAIANGLLKRDELPSELLEHLQNVIAFYERDKVDAENHRGEE